MSKIIDFYCGHGLDQHDRTLEFVLTQDDAWWEGCHNHIQWVFPTDKPSQFNPEAPLLTEKDIKIFNINLVIRDNARRSFYRFLDFLGLKYDFDYGGVYAGPKFVSLLPKVWLEPNHNHLRITRCLEFLNLAGLYPEISGFYSFLMSLSQVFTTQIEDETFTFWYNAYYRI